MATISVIFGGKEERAYPLDKPRMVVGREPQCEIAIDNLGISRQHCVLVNKGDAYVVQDLGSANGTFVNGKKIVEHYLNDGDEIFLGKYVLKYKNEVQGKNEVQRDSSVVPDTLNTFVMDGAKIQEQLTKMRAQAGGPAQQPAVPPTGATAKDYAKAMDVPKPPDNTGSLKTLLIVGGIVVALLIIAVTVLLIVVLKKS